MSCRLLLVGEMSEGTYGWAFRAAARRMGVKHAVVAEPVMIGLARWRYVMHRMLAFFVNTWFRIQVLKMAELYRPDAVLVFRGSRLNDRTLVRLGSSSVLTLIFNDDFAPTHRAPDLDRIARCLPLYDLVVTQRPHRRHVIERLGVRRVLFQDFAYIPDLHFPYTEPVPDDYRSDIVFVGSPDATRVRYLARLVQAGADLAIYGPDLWWETYRNQLGTSIRGRLAWGREYAKVLAGTKIALCLVRESNYDWQSMRTFEIPAMGAFMLAQRTPDHVRLFKEGEEIACFSTVEEMVEKVEYYLSHDEERQRMAERAHRKITSGPFSTDHRFVEVLEEIDKLAGSHFDTVPFHDKVWSESTTSQNDSPT